MQIDFHHATTYVLARMAGFEHKDADIIAYASQYVDDCTHGGLLKFEDGQMYNRVPSAHTSLDIKHHLDALENHMVWSVFHFLPGNQGKGASETSADDFYEKIICRPNSEVAKRMIEECIKYRDEDYTLQRLGITMHVYADTYAHQGFAGVVDEVNTVKDIKLINENESFLDEVKRDLQEIKSDLISDVLPMGHGAALTYPDMPYLKWSYIDYRGELIVRNNTNIFMQASRKLLEELIAYRNALGDVTTPDLTSLESDLIQIKKNFESFRKKDGDDRHKKWLKSIGRGDFSFGPVEVRYIPKGEGSWKFEALKENVEDDSNGLHIYASNKDFMKSNYKKFHDTLQEHRLAILHDILPDFNICLA